MKMLDDDVRQSVLATLAEERLFRYDCQAPHESVTAVLEDTFARAVGRRFAVALNSCSSGLFLSLLTAGVKPGDWVAIPSFTFIAVPSAVVHAGARPVLIEMTGDYVMDLADFEAKIKNGKVKALLLSYMRGRIPDIDRVMQLCERYGVIFLEDSAHSLGVLYRGRQTGTFGLSATFSAQSYKMIDGGEGGLFVTDDKRVAYEAMLYGGCYETNWQKHFNTQDDEERLHKMTNAFPAFNFRMSNLSAAVLLPQIAKVEQRVERFNANFNRLAAILSACKRLRIPEFTEGVRPAADSIQWEFAGLSAGRIAEVIGQLREKGVKVDGFYGNNARCFWNWTFFEQEPDACPFTRKMVLKSADMRLKLHLTFDEIDHIGKTIVQTVNGG